MFYSSPLDELNQGTFSYQLIRLLSKSLFKGRFPNSIAYFDFSGGQSLKQVVVVGGTNKSNFWRLLASSSSSREIITLRLERTHAGGRETKRKHLHQFDNACDANKTEKHAAKLETANGYG